MDIFVLKKRKEKFIQSKIHSWAFEVKGAKITCSEYSREYNISKENKWSQNHNEIESNILKSVDAYLLPYAQQHQSYIYTYNHRQ